MFKDFAIEDCYLNPGYFRNLHLYCQLLHGRYLIPLLLQYDSTAEESDNTDARGVGTSVQIAKNLHAVQASYALSRLSGLGSSKNPTPYNQAAADALRALLTPKLGSMLKDKLSKDLLSTLNSNLESPEVNLHIFAVLQFTEKVSWTIHGRCFILLHCNLHIPGCHEEHCNCMCFYICFPDAYRIRLNYILPPLIWGKYKKTPG